MISASFQCRQGLLTNTEPTSTAPEKIETKYSTYTFEYVKIHAVVKYNSCSNLAICALCMCVIYLGRKQKCIFPLARILYPKFPRIPQSILFKKNFWIHQSPVLRVFVNSLAIPPPPIFQINWSSLGCCIRYFVLKSKNAKCCLLTVFTPFRSTFYIRLKVCGTGGAVCKPALVAQCVNQHWWRSV